MNIAHPIVESAVLRILELQDVEIQKQKRIYAELVNKENEKEIILNKKKEDQEKVELQKKEQELVEKKKMLFVLSETGCTDYGIEEQLSSITNIAEKMPTVPVKNDIYESIHAPKNRPKYGKRNNESYKFELVSKPNKGKAVLGSTDADSEITFGSSGSV